MCKKIILSTILPMIALVFMFGFTKSAFGIDVYFPQSLEWKVNQGWASLVEVTVLSNIRIEGVPQGMGWSDEDGYHYLLVLQIDDAIMDDDALWNWPRAGDELSIIAHSSVVLEEGQRYLAFISPHSLDGRWIARINQDRRISAIPPLGIYFREYDGYTIEQLRVIAAEFQGISITPNEIVAPQLDPPLPRGFDISSEWARESISRAHSLELIPHSLFAASSTFTDYTMPTTRAEFAALAVALYENMTGREITGRMNFNDTNDVNVQKMGYLGVVSGVGGGNFSPYGEITREQAAVILVRLLNAIHINLDTNLPAMLDLPHLPSVFTDHEQISPWAFNGVASAFGLNIMSGIGGRRFAPQSPYTREQSIVTVLRLFDMVNTGLSNY